MTALLPPIELSNGSRLHLVAGSILDYRGDCLVNAANEGCTGGFGVDELVNSSGGAELKAARKLLGGCATGDAKVTPAFEHINTNHIVHAVGPVYRVNRMKQGFDEDDERAMPYMLSLDRLLRDAYRAALSRSSECRATSVGLCLLSAGVFRGARALEDVVEIGLRVVAHSLATDHACAAGLRAVTLCAYTAEEQKALGAAGRRLRDELASGADGGDHALTRELLERAPTSGTVVPSAPPSMPPSSPSMPASSPLDLLDATLRDRARGALVGLALGDALGTANEFLKPGSFTPISKIVGGGKLDLLPGQFTDDTSMALCLAHSLIRTSLVGSAADQLAAYAEWLPPDDQYYPSKFSPTCRYIDAGIATRSSISKFRGGEEPSRCGVGAQHGSNGSLMRLAPAAIAALGEASFAEATAACGESSVPTHAHEAAVDCCRYYGGLLVGAMRGESRARLLAPRYAPLTEPSVWSSSPLCAAVDAVASGSWRGEGGALKQPPYIHNGGFAPVSMEAALWALESSSSFAEGALLAANLGDDADTVGAIYGSLAGALCGYASLPAEWVHTLHFAPLLVQAADALHELSISAGQPGRQTAAYFALEAVHSTIEAAYTPIIRRLAPGHGKPVPAPQWPRGYASRDEFEGETARVAQLARGKAAELAGTLAEGDGARLNAQVERVLADWGRQWQAEGRLLAERIEQARAVAPGQQLGGGAPGGGIGGLLAAIKARGK